LKLTDYLELKKKVREFKMKKLKKLHLQIALITLALPLLAATTTTPIHYKKSFETASRMALSIKATSADANGLASVGDFKKANNLLLRSISAWKNQTQSLRTLKSRPQSVEAIAYAETLTHKIFPEVNKLTNKLGSQRVEATKFRLVNALLQKVFRSYDRLDVSLFEPLIEDCELNECPLNEITRDQFFSAQRNLLVSELMLAHEFHKKLYDSHLEIKFLYLLVSNLRESIKISGFKTEFFCLQPEFNKTINFIQELQNSIREDSASHKAELINLKIKALGQRMLEIHHPESCMEKESRGA
jgi:hypothetical protein